jgi:hypothetical protein
MVLEADTFKCCEGQISEAGRDPCFESLQPLRHCVQPNIPVSTTSSRRIPFKFSNKTIQVYDLSFFTPNVKIYLI